MIYAERSISRPCEETRHISQKWLIERVSGPFPLPESSCVKLLRLRTGPIPMQILIDFFPIVVFFVTYKFAGIFAATAAVMVAMAVQIAIQWFRQGTVNKMLLISGALVGIFGGITLLFRNPIFIQWKPTIVNWLFAAAFLGSRFFGERTLTERMMGAAVQLETVMWRQLLVQTGLQFPWDDCVLVPGNQFFKCRDLPRNCSIQVGRTDEFVMIRVGPWTIHLAIDAESGFPEVDALIPDGNQAAATMSLSDSDADFLLKNIKRLPGRNDSNEAVTIDLNGSVIVRAKGDDQEHPTDLLLASSRRSGDPIRCSSDRGYLARAMSLGFREVSFIGSEAPLLCQDQHRCFVWALLSKDSIIPEDPRAIRIESPVTDPAKHPLNHKRTENHKPTERTRRSMPTSNPSGNGQPTEEDSSSLSLIEQSESLKQSLQQALTQTRELIAALKRQKKQTQLVQTTLNSLRQLQSVDV